MKHPIVICAGLLALGLAVAQTAQAQPVYYGPRYYSPGLPPYQVMQIVRVAGFAPLSRPMRRGPNYVVIAADRAGTQVRVVVNAYAGNIVNVRPVFAQRPFGPPVVGVYAPPPRVVTAPPAIVAPPPGYGPSAGLDDGPRPVPPRDVPSQRFANAPSAVMAAPPRPARMPMPRPRPSVSSNETTAVIPVAPAQPPTAKPATPPATDTQAVAPAKDNGAAKPATTMVPVAPLD